MVRLKELQRIIINPAPQISIPYGAIKSCFEKTRFCYDRDFNSLWCD